VEDKNPEKSINVGPEKDGFSKPRHAGQTLNRQLRWFLAIRPKTLGIALAPVIAGSVLAWVETPDGSWPTFFITLFAALMIQIGTNLYNDAVDFERGTDTPARLGPMRATAEGWFSSLEVRRAAYTSFALAFLSGIPLTWIGGWPIVIVGLISLAAGYAYTGGPKPIAYSTTGEIFVFIFFGLIAVLGSYYLQAGTLSLNALSVSIAIGLLAAAVLLVNNYRDLDTDILAGKLTLAYLLGRKNSQRLYAILLLCPFALPLLLIEAPGGSWLILAALPLALLLIRRFIKESPGAGFNKILAHTAQLQLIYTLLLSIGLVLDLR